MLKVYFGDRDDVIYNTSVYFKFNYQPDWLQDPDIQQMILDVDKSVVLGNGAIDSPVLGVIAPVTLSGGVKTLILIDKVPDKMFNASNCGDNCAAWLLKIGRKKDVTVIQGDSATGKTILVDMIQEYLLNGSDTGISVSCDCP